MSSAHLGGVGALDERRATAFVFDAARDVARVVVCDASARATKRAAAASLLLDANGFLVGVDLEPESDRRIVVMLGPHEAVAETRDAIVDVVDDAGEPCEVEVKNAASACRASAKNPYV